MEPTSVYPSIFRGIVIGTMRSHDAPIPDVSTRASSADGSKQRWEFEVRW